MMALDDPKLWIIPYRVCNVITILSSHRLVVFLFQRRVLIRALLSNKKASSLSFGSLRSLRIRERCPPRSILVGLQGYVEFFIIFFLLFLVELPNHSREVSLVSGLVRRATRYHTRNKRQYFLII
jgi:hypothetical protein